MERFGRDSDTTAGRRKLSSCQRKKKKKKKGLAGPDRAAKKTYMLRSLRRAFPTFCLARSFIC